MSRVERAETPLTFGAFQLSRDRQLLLRDGEAVRLGGRALDLLTALVERAGDLVSKEELIERIWPGLHVADVNLRVHVAMLRKVLGDGGAGERFINTVAGRGYCFVAQVSDAQGADAKLVIPGLAMRNLPAPLTRMIGRDRAVALVAAQLSHGRFVTIVGPGGIGKTTLAVAIAGNIAAAFQHGVCFVDLGPVVDPRLVASALASALGIAVHSASCVPVLLANLLQKSMLIVLDNCEHVIDSAAALAESVLKGGPGVHLLATSREPFRAEGEWLHRLSSLEVPPASVQISTRAARQYPALALFIERATAVLDTFELTDGNVAAASEVCRRLDGIPLAIELAAAHVDLFSMRELAARLADSFSLLETVRRTALPRHRTLHAALDWSHGLLSPDEQVVFRRLALMAGRFTMEAAAAIASGAGIHGSDVAEHVAMLVRKSLVTADVGDTIVRFRLFETTRAHAAERLAQSGEEQSVARRRATYFRAVMRRSETEARMQSSADWLSTYASCIDDVRAAIEWALASADDLPLALDLTAASAQLWFQLSLMVEYRNRVEAALRRLSEAGEPSPVLEMQLQAALGHALWYSTIEPSVMEPAFARALVLAEQVRDAPVQLQALWGLWAVRRGSGEYRAALAVATRYADLARETGDQSFILLGARILSLTLHYLGDQELARQQVELARGLAGHTGHILNTGLQVDPQIALPALLARIQWLQGYPDQARATVQTALDAGLSADHWFSIYYVLSIAGCPLALWTGNLLEAEQHLALAASRGAGNPGVDVWFRCYDLILRLRRSAKRADALVAASIEPRLDLSTRLSIAALASATTIAVPMPEAEPADALWCLPEVLRVDAELLLWHDVPGASRSAAAKLHRSLQVARQQSALSWELRSAMTLSQLWQRDGRRSQAHDLLAATCDRFTEGFETGDFIRARQLISEWK